MSRRGNVAAATLAAMLCACAHGSSEATARQYGLPVYPGATMEARSESRASIALYRTPDSLDEVYYWYVGHLPSGTPRAYSALKNQATFALFDAKARRTVHLKMVGSSTVIEFTNLTQ